AVHQFCRVGEHAFIGGGTMCTQDVLPYAKTVAARDNNTYGINTIGLQRKGFSQETIDALQRAYKLLVRSKLKVEDALMQIENDFSMYPEARYLVEFVRSSKRGVIR
ncbi:MAG TPA: acyl-[acyl-carrier-protein]--UDP-N-acetylglucosamine O-acyltransferase, partial [Thermoanaerobaculia bacterium]|nr:acyl-[acyl-carrier-protein]--UDP-N-acetylglucosamine O-acyltransferase [Thermoanaerobaculia bacterium]